MSKDFNRSSSFNSRLTIKSPPHHCTNKRYSDCNIVFLEDHDKKNHEEERVKLLKRKDKMIEQFKKKHIIDPKGGLCKGVVEKKYKDGTRFIG